MRTSIRLEQLRGKLRAECISYGELVELQGLSSAISPGDVELLEAAGVPEYKDTEGSLDLPYMRFSQERFNEIRDMGLLRENVAYRITDLKRGETEWAFSPDGVGCFWYDTYAEMSAAHA